MIIIWQKKPTSIEKYNLEDEFIISVDESGTDRLKFSDHDRFFTLTAVIIKRENFNLILESINNLKYKYWDNGRYNGKRIVLHGRDIRKKNPPFSDHQIDNKNFQKELIELLEILPFHVIAIHIDKEIHKNKYIHPEDVYSLCTMYLLERITLPLNRSKYTGVIMLESRGKKEDLTTLSKVKELMTNGNNYLPSQIFNKITGVYFNKQRTKCGKKSYWQLEISDIVSYNLHRHLVYKDNELFYKIIEKKIVKTRGSLTGLKIF